MSHSLFSPSSAHRWIACPGSIAFPENQEQGGTSKFADDGTASHHWAALCLAQNRDASFFLGAQLEYSTGIYEMDEARADFVQIYVDDVRRRAIGGSLYVEQRVDLSDALGDDQGGTCDAGIYIPADFHLIVEDLKYGTGEKVFASVPVFDSKRCEKSEINPQLGLYLLGLLKDMALLGNEVRKVTAVICQPRLGHIDEYTCGVGELTALAQKATGATLAAYSAVQSARLTEQFSQLNPGEKQCRWCRAKAKCPALAKFVADEVRADFDTIEASPPMAPRATDKLAKAKHAVPLIRDWCNAVDAEVHKLVLEGEKVIGPDGLPYKFVEGKEGSRAWLDAQAAEIALLGQLPPEKAYAPQKIITAPQAAKLLDKKATKALWSDVFVPLIGKAPGKALLVSGSDPRPPYAGAANAEDFEELSE
jgi:Protein of unknown function (DUF2800)